MPPVRRPGAPRPLGPPRGVPQPTVTTRTPGGRDLPPRVTGSLRLLLPDDDPLDLELIGPVLPVEEGYQSGFTMVDRPMMRAGTAWGGTQPLRQAAPIIIDGVPAGRSVSPRWRRLVELGRPEDGDRPVAFKVEGPVLHRGAQWSVAGIAPLADPEPVWGEDEELLRIAATVTLLERVDIDPVRMLTRRERAKRRLPPAHTTKKGDTWESVAKTQMRGDPRKLAQRVASLRRANPKVKVRGPREALPTGKKLVIP